MITPGQSNLPAKKILFPIKTFSIKLMDPLQFSYRPKARTASWHVLLERKNSYSPNELDITDITFGRY